MKLIDFLPEAYKKSPPTIEIQNALDRMCGKIETDIEDLRKQFFLSTATWGLSLWEWMYGIETDLSRDTEWRRSRVGAKIRGKGTTTVGMIRNTAEAYTNGECDVVEYNAESRFEVVMVSIIGIPPNLDDLQKTIEEIKPAHLDFRIVIRYNTWGMAEAKGFTWADLANRTWKEAKEVAF
jgi:hypothetical protein